MQHEHLDVGDLCAGSLLRAGSLLISPLGLFCHEERGPDAEDISERKQGEDNAHRPHGLGLRANSP